MRQLSRVLAAVCFLVLAVEIATAAAQNDATNQSAPLGTQLEKSDKLEKSELDRRLVDLTHDLARFTGGLFYATLALFVATAVLAWFAFRQSRDMKLSMRIAGDATAAAKASANAAEQSVNQARENFRLEKRAYVAHMPNGAHFEMVKAAAGYFPLGPVKYFEINQGATPALRVKMFVCIRQGANSPPNFDGPFEQLEVMRMVHPGQNIGKIVGTQTSKDAFFLYGFVKYFDIFGSRWKRRFAFGHDPDRPKKGQDAWIAHSSHNDELAWDPVKMSWIAQ